MKSSETKSENGRRAFTMNPLTVVVGGVDTVLAGRYPRAAPAPRGAGTRAPLPRHPPLPPAPTARLLSGHNTRHYGVNTSWKERQHVVKIGFMLDCMDHLLATLGVVLSRQVAFQCKIISIFFMITSGTHH